MYRLLVEQAAAAPWGVVVGLYTFHPSRPDAALLGRIARVAREAGAPFLAAASCGLLGCESLAETPDPEDWRQPVDREAQQAWDALRRLPEAFSVGLALPRFLLRPPYGKDTSAVESFAFEEIPGRPRPEDYLWGNPACACACLLGEAFSRHGWTLRPGASREVGGLPVHVYREDGESQVWPVAEALLPERAVEAILAQGLMPLLSARGGDAVRLARWQSLADPPTPLAGRWGAGL